MKLLVYLFMFLFLLTACRSNRIVERSSDKRYDSLLMILTEKATVLKNTEYRQQIIIDSLRNVALPRERSQNVLPTDQRSELETSFARSFAWTDSLGLLHHVIENKDSARVPQRTVTLNHERSDKEATTSALSVATKVNDKTEIKEIESVATQKERFAGKFFYYSGWVFWVGVVVSVIYYLQTHTALRPITRLISLFRNIIKK